MFLFVPIVADHEILLKKKKKKKGTGKCRGWRILQLFGS
jgi:hypothetical protein